MNLYLIFQEENIDYDTYNAAVVCAPDEETARNMHPGNGISHEIDSWSRGFRCWCSSPNQVTVKYIGKANEGIEQCVILASYNAG